MNRNFWLELLVMICLSVAVSISCDSENNGGSNDENKPDDDDNDIVYGDTWTDSSSGLTWQVTPTGSSSLEDAISNCQNLSLAGGGWRLPSISELRTLIRGCQETITGGSCGVTDTCLDTTCWDSSCQSCPQGVGPNNGCYGPEELRECGWTLSSTTCPELEENHDTWGVDFRYGGIWNSGGDYYGTKTRCVR